MRVFIVPSWYPSDSHLFTGIFFREQAKLIAKHRPDWQVGISLWGSHEPKLWLQVTKPLTSLLRYGSKPVIKKKDTLLESNCVEFMTPAFTWTRKINKGNIEGIVQANEENLNRYIQYFGPPDVLHAHVAYPAGYIAERLSSKFQIPFVITEHQSPFPMSSLHGILKSRMLPTMKSANAVLTVSEALKQVLRTHGVESSYFPNFIDDEQFVSVETSSAEPLAIAVGRLEDQKNYELMLKAIALVKRERPIELKVIGDGREKHRLRQLARCEGVEVEWLGEQDQEAVCHHLQASSLFLTSSKHENQPVAILEALACGLPVVSTSWAGAEEMVTSEVGLLAESWEPEDYARAILEMLEQMPSKNTVRSYFEKKYSASQSVSRLEEIYQSVKAQGCKSD